MPISSWSTTPGSNTAAPPNGAPEGMAPSTVNDIMRQQMADHRTQWNDAQWFNYGDSGISRASASSFKITTDVTARYEAGRRLKMYDATTLYGVVASSSYSAPDTTINVTTDSGNLTASLTSVALGILTPTNISIPAYSPTFTNITGSGNLQIAGTSSLSGAAVCKTTLNVEGATTLSGVAVLKGATTLESTATISGAAVFKTTATVEGASTFSGAAVFSTTLKLDTANLNRKGTDIASATTTDLATATGDFVDITGTTTITGLGTLTAGVERKVRFTGALTLTHNATSLILPSAANITTAANDTATFLSLGSGNWLCLNYKRADGTAIVGGAAAGQVIQVVSATYTATTSTTSSTFGTVYSASITPASSSNKIISMATVCLCNGSTATYSVLRVVRGSTVIVQADAASNRKLSQVAHTGLTGGGDIDSTAMVCYDSPATTSSTTYNVQIASTDNATAVYVNRTGSDTDSSVFPRGSSTLILMEVKG